MGKFDSIDWLEWLRIISLICMAIGVLMLTLCLILNP